MRYSISIQTNTTGDSWASFATKKEALKKAAYMRTGGLGSRYVYSKYDNANIEIFDTKKEVVIYCKPMFKYALK
jgi:hypothetical protein